MIDTNACQRIAEFFKALGDETRIKIIWVLNEESKSVSDLALALEMSQSAISHQLSTLRNANLVKYQKKGKEVFYYLADDHVKKMFEAGLEHVHR